MPGRKAQHGRAHIGTRLPSNFIYLIGRSPLEPLLDILVKALLGEKVTMQKWLEAGMEQGPPDAKEPTPSSRVLETFSIKRQLSTSLLAG
jgi:hypothetical protein